MLKKYYIDGKFCSRQIVSFFFFQLHARTQKIFSGWVQIPRRGLTENFNIAKINNLAIPVGGGGGPEPLSPSGSAYELFSDKRSNIIETHIIY